MQAPGTIVVGVCNAKRGAPFLHGGEQPRGPFPFRHVEAEGRGVSLTLGMTRLGALLLAGAVEERYLDSWRRRGGGLAAFGSHIPTRGMVGGSWRGKEERYSDSWYSKHATSPNTVPKSCPRSLRGYHESKYRSLVAPALSPEAISLVIRLNMVWQVMAVRASVKARCLRDLGATFGSCRCCIARCARMSFCKPS